MKQETFNSIRKIHLIVGMVFLALMSFFTSQAKTCYYKDSGTTFTLLDSSILLGQSDVAYETESLYTVNSEEINLKAGDILSTSPVNDECVNATALDCGETVTGDTSTGTDSGGNPTPDLWYSYTGSGDQESVTISLCDGGTDYDSYLRLFDACGGTEIVTNDNFCGIWSEISFTSDGISTYHIMVDGWGTTSSGNFSLAVTCEPIGGGDCTEVEYFEDGLPTGWSTVINTGNCDWENKSYLPTGDQFSTLAMVFDDDFCYVDAPASNVTLLSDVYNTNGATSVLLSYDIAFQVSGTVQTATVEVYDGTAWQQIAFYDEDLDPDIQTESMDITVYSNADLQVRWTYDDNNEWAWHLGIDNFCLTHDGVLGISDNEIEGFSYFPNPTTNGINLSARENIEKVSIYNILGQKVVNQNSNTTSIQVDVDHLTTGTYFMEVSATGKTATYKIIKE